MTRPSLGEVRRHCAEGRYFSYEGLNDRMFAPVSVFLVWVFVRLGWSGHAVSLLSGAAVAAGGALLASGNPLLVFVGSFGYLSFYLLDYVDGGVARFRKQAGISGQYVDWLMHVVAAVGTAAGLFAGALPVVGNWIVPFGLLSVLAAALALDRYALGWFSICMHHQQRQSRGEAGAPVPAAIRAETRGRARRLLRNASTALFHESYMIYTLPVFGAAHLLAWTGPFDFRVVLTVLGGALYFPVVLFDIWTMATSGRVDRAYERLFFGTSSPKLPEDHYFG